MEITLKKITSIDNFDKETILKLSSWNDLENFLANSFNFIKTLKAFYTLINETSQILDANKNTITINKKFLIDHKEYANLFLAFNSYDEILLYVQDVCEARGDSIPKSIKSAINYLNNEKTVIYEILKFELDKNNWNDFYNFKINENKKTTN